MKLRFLGDQPHEVSVLRRVVEPDELVDVPDDVFEAYVWPDSLWMPEPAARATRSDKPAQE